MTEISEEMRVRIAKYRRNDVDLRRRLIEAGDAALPHDERTDEELARDFGVGDRLMALLGGKGPT